MLPPSEGVSRLPRPPFAPALRIAPQHSCNYCCYYGRGQLDLLCRFDLLILQPLAYSPGELAWLRARGARILAYLSVGEEPNGSDVASQLALRSPSGAPCANPCWPTSIIDVRRPEWSSLLLDQRIPLLRSEFDGLFLDTLDAHVRYPELQESMTALVWRIRGAWPSAVLLANRGFHLLDSIAPALDGVVFEAFSSYYRSGAYHDWHGADREYTDVMAGRLAAARERRSLLTLALDYAAPGDQRRLARSVQRARSAGLIPYVSTFDLQAILWAPPVRSACEMMGQGPRSEPPPAPR